ncbi:MAG: hypothetical protein LBL21_00560 [Rickettsiales bacterium]|jgi:hypothetical protein|nr:hypothetical protein [Rickettsiales bacterium]
MFNFFIDFTTEYNLLLYFLSYPTGNSPEERAIQYKIPNEVSLQVRDGTDNGNALKRFLEKRYSDNEKKLKEFVDYASGLDYSEYLARLSRIFGYDFPDYKIRINTNHAGTSDWTGTDGVSLRFDFDQSEWMHYILWETILSQTFQLVRKMPEAKDFPDMDSDNSGKSVWGMAEITAWVITELSDDFHFKKHIIGYPQLVKYGDSAAKLYSERADFYDYLGKLVDFFKE